jgi:hypothetical protein
MIRLERVAEHMEARVGMKSCGGNAMTVRLNCTPRFGCLPIFAAPHSDDKP